MFVPQRLKDAREDRQKTKQSLAEEVGVTLTAISKYEKGDTTPRAETLAKIASALEMPADYFEREFPKFDGTGIRFRSLKREIKAMRNRARHRLFWSKQIANTVFEYLVTPKVNLPPICRKTDIRDISASDVESMAKSTRRFWGMGDGPISNVMLLLEKNGISVTSSNLGTDAMDGLSQIDGYLDRPFILLNDHGQSAARWRFDLAHELGHLVLHQKIAEINQENKDLYNLMEKQAHTFAAHFLFPRDAFLSEVKSANLKGFLMLKSRWKVSVKMMVFRCKELGLINQNQASNLFRNINRRGWAKLEPLDDSIPLEKPVLLERCFKKLKEAFTPEEIRRMIGLSGGDIENLVGLESGFFSDDLAFMPQFKVDGRTNVIPFQRRKN